MPKQRQFLASSSREKMFVAGIGSGKTEIACWWGVTRTLQKRHVIMTEPTFGMCKRNLIPTFDKVFGKLGFKENIDYRLNKTDLEYSFSGGGKIYLCSGDNPDRLRGLNAHDGLIDEAQEESDDELLRVLVGRCRNDGDGQIRITMTPKPKKWIKEKFAQNPDAIIRQSTIENFFLPAAYIQGLKDSYGEGSLWYRQEVLGELVDFSTGLIEAHKIAVLGDYAPFYSKVCRAWDFAHTDKKGSDYTASVLMSTDGVRYIIHDVTRWKGEYHTVREKIIQTMSTDPANCTQYIEDTLGGKVVRSDLSSEKRLARVPIMAVQANHDKLTRALPFASRVAQGLVSMRLGQWNRPFIDELNAFGNGCEHDDQVDAASHAYNCITRNDTAQAGRVKI